MRDGFTIAVSESKHISQIARRTVLSTNALAVLGPILEETVGWERPQIRQFFESYGILMKGTAVSGFRHWQSRPGVAVSFATSSLRRRVSQSVPYTIPLLDQDSVGFEELADLWTLPANCFLEDCPRTASALVLSTVRRAI